MHHLWAMIIRILGQAGTNADIKHRAHEVLEQWEQHFQMQPWTGDRRKAPTQAMVNDRRHAIGQSASDFEERVTRLEDEMFGYR
jgi:hypothetical protein